MPIQERINPQEGAQLIGYLACKDQWAADSPEYSSLRSGCSSAVISKYSLGSDARGIGAII